MESSAKDKLAVLEATIKEWHEGFCHGGHMVGAALNATLEPGSTAAALHMIEPESQIHEELALLLRCALKGIPLERFGPGTDPVPVPYTLTPESSKLIERWVADKITDDGAPAITPSP